MITRLRTWRRVWIGVRLALPLTVSVGVYGAIFGVLAREAGLTLTQGVAMSIGAYAGSAQFVALELWSTPLPVLTIVATVVLVNLRHVLFGISLYPWIQQQPKGRLYSSALVMVDGSWAIAMTEFRKGNGGLGVLVGSGLVMYVGWVVGTAIGMMGGNLVGDPAHWGLDFLNMAALIALLCTLTDGQNTRWPWLVAAVVAVLSERFLPGEWYILLGGITGSIIGGLRHEQRD